MRNRLFVPFILVIMVMSGLGCRFVQPRPTPTVEKTLPFAWPVEPLTKEQVLAVKQCDLENLAKQRYPETVTSDDLLKTYQPQTDCDWAILASAYANRLENNEPLSKPALQAFARAATDNIGYAFATPLFYKYFGGVSMVKAPGFAQQEITDVSIKYGWMGLGDSVNYSVEIHHADTAPMVTSTRPGTLSIDKATVQTLRAALTDFLPVGSKFQLQPCFDNYPEWSVRLTFADKTDLEATTDSNFMYIGGPWFIEAGRQSYMQFSSAFGQALGKVIQSLGLPLGETAAMSCFGDTVFDKAYP